MEQNTCPVCYKNTKLSFGCGHSICQPCARKMKDPRCPLCREIVSVYNISGVNTRNDHTIGIMELTSHLNHYDIIKDCGSKTKFNAAVKLYKYLLTHKGYAIAKCNPKFRKVMYTKIDQLIEQSQEVLQKEDTDLLKKIKQCL